MAHMYPRTYDDEGNPTCWICSVVLPPWSGRGAPRKICVNHSKAERACAYAHANQVHAPSGKRFNMPKERLADLEYRFDNLERSAAGGTRFDNIELVLNDILPRLDNLETLVTVLLNDRNAGAAPEVPTESVHEASGPDLPGNASDASGW